MKKLFKNYNFEFDKNERKVLLAFCKKLISQLGSQEGADQYRRIFESIINKLNSPENIVKFTKEEKTRLTFSLNENLKFFEKEIKKAWFFKKWLYKSMYGQYRNLVENHFSD